MDQWGTANPMNEFVAARSFNDLTADCSSPRGFSPWPERAARSNDPF